MRRCKSCTWRLKPTVSIKIRARSAAEFTHWIPLPKDRSGERCATKASPTYFWSTSSTRLITIYRIPASHHVESVEHLQQRVQGNGAHTAVQGNGQAGGVSVGDPTFLTPKLSRRSSL